MISLRMPSQLFMISVVKLQNVLMQCRMRELDTAKIEERLDQIRHLMQKYRCDEEGLLELTEKKSRSLKKIPSFEEEEKARAQKLCQNAFVKLEQAANDLSRKEENADLLSRPID